MHNAIALHNETVFRRKKRNGVKGLAIYADDSMAAFQLKKNEAVQ